MEEMNQDIEISHRNTPISDFLDNSNPEQVFKELERLKQNKEVFLIPMIKLVGYGRKQSYQCLCLKCKNLFFNIVIIRDLDDLFCSFCCSDVKFLTKENISPTNFVGIIIGWEVKTSSTSKKRSFYNYKKVYLRDRYTCQYCNYNFKNCAEFRALHIDHIKPWSAGGSNVMENLVVSCDKCNIYASDKWFSSFWEKKQFINLKIKELPICVV